MNLIIVETIVNPVLQITDDSNEVVISIDEVVNNINLQVQDIAIPGQTGKSFYSLAVEAGFTGTLEEYLETQKNIDGGLIY